MSLGSMTNAQLVTKYNELAPEVTGTKPIIQWRGQTKVLLGKIAELQDKIIQLRRNGVGGRTVRQASLELLCAVDYYEDKSVRPSVDNKVAPDHARAGAVGIPYSQIIVKIKEAFPSANTSAACLRWYAVKVRAGEAGYEGLTLPRRRPRTKAVAA